MSVLSTEACARVYRFLSSFVDCVESPINPASTRPSCLQQLLYCSVAMVGCPKQGGASMDVGLVHICILAQQQFDYLSVAIVGCPNQGGPSTAAGLVHICILVQQQFDYLSVALVGCPNQGSAALD
eukprot:Hpha_TRINITY_DN16580_c1_g1::TRINITY_DN16580_c1_g1_i3::g.132447::m.132447